MITLENLHFGYGKGKSYRPLLKDISLHIPRGELCILTGPSGSGKTTLLTVIGALRMAEQGRVSILGHELVPARPHTIEAVRQQVGYIFQHHHLMGALTVLQNVCLPLERYWHLTELQRQAKARELLEILGMRAQASMHPTHLSGGQRQRVAIARALVQDPLLILADEPTASLDRDSGAAVMEVLRERVTQGASVLLITHDPRIIRSTDRILHLEEGILGNPSGSAFSCQVG